MGKTAIRLFKQAQMQLKIFAEKTKSIIKNQKNNIDGILSMLMQRFA